MRIDKLHNRYKAVIIGGSAGSFQGISRILSGMPPNFPLPVIMCLHRLKHVRNGFIEALSIKSINPVIEPCDKESVKRGKLYLAPANYHMSIELGQTFSLSTECMVNNSRPSIDIAFESAAYVYQDKLIGILLSGANADGAHGMQCVEQKGGLTVVQDPAECMIATMPAAAMSRADIDYVLKIEEIIAFFNKLAKLYQ